MSNSELTGIERQLVLQYLIDGNVPVTVTEIQSSDNGTNFKDNTEQTEPKKNIKNISWGVFPVALHGEQLTVLSQGIILLKNPPEAVKNFDGKEVRVQFYFNKLGLFFITKMKSIKSGLALVIPEKIKKIEEEPEKESGNFSATLFYESGKKTGELNIKCGFITEYKLFVQPKWSDIKEEYQTKAKKYLEKAVMTSRSIGNSIGNGLHLINVSKYLSQEQLNEETSIEGRKTPPAIIYIDHEKIVFAGKKENITLEIGLEYAIKLGFPIVNSPIKERTVYLTFVVENIFENDETTKACAICKYTSIKEEDVRYLHDKMSS